ncbi:GFA family protein [Hyphomicrobium sp.]|uniref:GFA family protein n=1 Tax=Hyphomicrobium sp. TaxID=82 RepID=UPI002E36EC35|nr:GFA family protein [Hyphomicrobium sp.]HEX2842798.1 GFA family protein [Hyphomicrobium sp.]
MTPSPTGGCLCGAVRFRLTGPPFEIDYCHCATCRKHTGAPVSVFLDCKRDLVEFTQGAPTYYESSPGIQRGFCGKCGATLTYETGDEIHIHVGAMDHPEDFPPHNKPAFPEERLAWFQIAGHKD